MRKSVDGEFMAFLPLLGNFASAGLDNLQEPPAAFLQRGIESGAGMVSPTRFWPVTRLPGRQCQGLRGMGPLVDDQYESGFGGRHQAHPFSFLT
jgi:hypothetical protein